MFQGLRWRLLLSQLMVMAAILSIFGAGVYVFLSRNLYRQQDKKLLTLARQLPRSYKSKLEEVSFSIKWTKCPGATFSIEINKV
jgi:Na+-translocating ferredoxin:NAD+ oxidoreductase RnfG subunit